MIPGSCLLTSAMALIGATDGAMLYKFTGRTENNFGILVSTYASPVELIGVSIQPVNRKVYQQYGLDFQKNYITIWAPDDLQDLARDTSGDYITWNGRKWQLMSGRDWHAVDGWTTCIAVEVLE